MRFTLIMFAVAGLSFPVAAQADDSAAPNEKKICRQVMVTGSITPLKRVCLTQAEWQQVETEMAPINAKGISDTIGSGRTPGGKRGSGQGSN